jgi:hypothetical protein
MQMVGIALPMQPARPHLNIGDARIGDREVAKTAKDARSHQKFNLRGFLCGLRAFAVSAATACILRDLPRNLASAPKDLTISPDRIYFLPHNDLGSV